jgi:hypothetical protein
MYISKVRDFRKNGRNSLLHRLSKLPQAVMPLTCILGVTCSNLGQDNDCPKVFVMSLYTSVNIRRQ